MTRWINHTGYVAGRVLNQLRRDHRLIGIALGFPLVIIYFIKVLFDALANPLFNISIYVVPYGAFVVHFLTFMLTAIVLVRDRRAGTMTRTFVSGYNQAEIVMGYLLAYTVLVTLQSLLILAELNWLFALEYTFDRLAAIYLVYWLLSVISMVLGIFLSSVARNEGHVVVMLPIIIVSVIISGIIIPVEKLPEWTQLLSFATPLYYANEVLQEVIADGKMLDTWQHLAGLPVYGLVVAVLAMLSLRERD
ncbi:MAG TPA: ABC transporter permease [Anaerolineaceae bacterium]|nr:ABC transporter permease [Anaerolineaceae bacterium]HQP09132.1 ABC transporter permease [Anaerolineaceae bacterium]